MHLPFFQVDVFGRTPFKGNPVAVILDGDKLTSSQMLEIAKVEVRSFVPGDAVPEDPVCGSGNGCVAAMLQRSGIAPSRYSASQGNKVGRDGRIEVEFSSDGTILIGGISAIRVQGSISLTP